MKYIERDKLNYWLKFSITVLAALLAVYILGDYVLPVLGRFAAFIGPILLPFILAFVLSALLEPLVGLLERKLKMSRTWAALNVVLLTLIAIIVIIGALISRLINEIAKMIDRIPDLQQYVDAVTHFMNNIYNFILLNVADINTIKESLQKLIDAFSEWTNQFLNSLLNFLMFTPSLVLIVIVTILGTYFFIKDKDKLLRRFAGLFPASKRNQVVDTYSNATKAFSGYFRAQITVMSITMVLCTIGFLILGTPYAFTMGLLTGLFDIIPVLGPGTLIIPWAVLSLISGNMKLGIGLIIIYAVITVSRQVLEPKIVSQNIGLHPLAGLAAIFIGLQMFGVIGLIAGPILLVLILGIFRASKDNKDIIKPVK
ncbi:MAG: sporulation integral membrane protein YtvI [Clostridia bacterium]|nr:sporulation integral membrane protein YtvI [Clostridia bacterium]MDD4571673.1 sporulation integral membrane protein YtvI [Clostridia bacterium]